MEHTHLADNLKKIWISLEEFKKMREATRNAYYSISKLGLYWDTYTELQNIEETMYRIYEGEFVEEDELDDVYFFYVNNYK